jgi:hypothetical protein
MMKIKPLLVVFKPPDIHVLANKPRFAKGQPFEFGLGSRIVHELGFFGKGSKNPTTHTSTPRFVEEVVREVM